MNKFYEALSEVIAEFCVENGNENSGHYGHAGIKGYRGGSLPKGVNPNFSQELEDFIKLATENKLYNGEIKVGSLSKHAQKAANNYNVDLTGYTHTVDAKAIRHRNNRILPYNKKN